MKHVQPPSDGEVLPLDPADDDPLLPRRSTAAIWLALAVACTGWRPRRTPRMVQRARPRLPRRGRTLERRRLDGLGTSPSIRS
jgi:hypothetical protein